MNLTLLVAPVAAMTAIVVVRYLLIAVAVFALVWRRSPTRARRLSRRSPSAAQMRGEVGLSLISSVIYAAPAALAMEAWKAGGTRLYSDLSPSAWPGMAASAVVYLLLHDAFYYWSHRLMHWKPLFRAFHAGHHRHVEPSPFAGFAFDPLEAALTGWFLPALVFVIPMEAHLAVTLLMVITVTGVINHCGWEVWPQRWVKGAFGRWIVVPSHHSQHHARFGANYGLHFQIWDRAMGTNAASMSHPAWARGGEAGRAVPRTAAGVSPPRRRRAA